MMPLLLRERLLALCGSAGVFLLLLGGSAFHTTAPPPKAPAPREVAQTPEVNASASLSVNPEPPSNISTPLDTRKTVLVDRSARRVTVLQEGKSLATFQADIGGAGTPTPTGTFAVNAMKIAPAWKNPRTGEIVPPGAGNPIGSRWIGFADIARGSVGFHEATDGGTGRAASQGCVRLRRQDLEALYTHVREGMPVIVQE